MALPHRTPRASTADSRKFPRYPMSSAVRIGWIGRRRQMTYVVARGIDISEHGVAIRTARPLPLSALVHLDLGGCGMTAAGHVRHCLPDRGEWRMGIEVPHLYPGSAA